MRLEKFIEGILTAGKYFHPQAQAEEARPKLIAIK